MRFESAVESLGVSNSWWSAKRGRGKEESGSRGGEERGRGEAKEERTDCERPSPGFLALQTHRQECLSEKPKHADRSDEEEKALLEMEDGRGVEDEWVEEGDDDL